MKKRDAKVLEGLERAQAIWTLTLRGHSPSQIGDALGTKVTAADITSANSLVGAAYINELEVETLRGIEAAKLDAIAESLWDRATGRPFESIIERLFEEGAYDDEEVKIVRRILETAKEDQVACARMIVQISERKGKLLALDAQVPSINAIIMPTVQFNVPRPGERNLEENGITIAAEPVDQSAL